MKGFEYVWKKKWSYLMLLFPVLYYIIFKYIPMGGLVMAFQDYNIFRGVFDSKFVGFSVFEKIFRDKQFWNVVRNTLMLNLLTLAMNFPLTIGLALLLNEVTNARFKKLSQSLLYLPHFISWVVVAGIAMNLFSHDQGGRRKSCSVFKQ